MKCNAAGYRLDAERLLAARLPVVVTIGAKGFDRQLQILGSTDAGELHVGGVLPVTHPDALFKTSVRKQPGPYRDQALKPK